MMDDTLFSVLSASLNSELLGIMYQTIGLKDPKKILKKVRIYSWPVPLSI